MKNKGWLIFGISLALIMVIGIVILLNQDQPPLTTGKPNEGNSTKPPGKPGDTNPPAGNPVVTPPVVLIPAKVGDSIKANLDGVQLYDTNLNPASIVNKGVYIGVVQKDQNGMFQFITASGIHGWVSKINVKKA